MSEELFSEKDLLFDKVEEPETEFQFYLYSRYASFSKVGNRLIVENFASKGVMVEMMNPNRKMGDRYISDSFETLDLIKEWKNFFPTYESEPNVLINGFRHDGQRKLLTLTISNPQIVEKNIYFDYDLDQFESKLDILPGVIGEWSDRENVIKDVSVLIDTYFGARKANLGRPLGNEVSSVEELQISTDLERKFSTLYPELHKSIWGRVFTVDSKKDGEIAISGKVEGRSKVGVFKN